MAVNSETLISPQGVLHLPSLGLASSDVDGFLDAAQNEPLLASATDETIRAYVYWRAFSQALQIAALGPTQESVGRYSVTYNPNQVGYLTKQARGWEIRMLQLQPNLSALIAEAKAPQSVAVEVEAGI